MWVKRDGSARFATALFPTSQRFFRQTGNPEPYNAKEKGVVPYLDMKEYMESGDEFKSWRSFNRVGIRAIKFGGVVYDEELEPAKH